jgi:hypothetical protein
MCSGGKYVYRSRYNLSADRRVGSKDDEELSEIGYASLVSNIVRAFCYGKS